MNEIETAWFAGLYEGEACLSKNKGDQRWWRIQIVMTDLDVLQRAHEILGVGTLLSTQKKKVRPHHKDQWTLAVYKREGVVDILTAILPFLGERRKAMAEQALHNLLDPNTPRRKTRRHGANG